MASASSGVSSLRVRISSVGRPKVKGSRWKAKIIFEPRLAIIWLTLSFNPRTIDEMPMTTATPITMPSTVRDERSLLLRIVSTAMFSPSPSSPLTCMLRLKPQRRYRIQHRCPFRGIDPKKYSDTRRYQPSRRHRPELDFRGHADRQRDDFSEGNADHNPNRTAK